MKKIKKILYFFMYSLCCNIIAVTNVAMKNAFGVDENGVKEGPRKGP